jgi:hypothetical protein
LPTAIVAMPGAGLFAAFMRSLRYFAWYLADNKSRFVVTRETASIMFQKPSFVIVCNGTLFIINVLVESIPNFQIIPQSKTYNIKD